MTSGNKKAPLSGAAQNRIPYSTVKDPRGITQEVHDNYLMYHQERLENAFEDIDSLLATGKHAW